MFTAVLVTAGIAAVAWLATPGPTRRRTLRTGPTRSALRSIRALCVRAALAVPAWPHLADLLMGTRAAAPGSSPKDEVWRSGAARLWRYRGVPARAEPVLLVHALVTRPWILDLTPETSLARALLDAGHDVFLLDWGEPGRGDARRGLAHCVRTLVDAERRVLAVASAGRLHLVGYCSGGTVSVLRLATHPHDAVASAATIAAPIDFASPGGILALLAGRLLKPALLLDGRGLLPAAVIREAFHSIRPRAIRSVLHGLRARRDPVARTYHAALARWAWEQRPMPGALFFDLVDLCRSNAIVAGTCDVGGRPVDLGVIETPLLSVVASRDHIVPAGSATALGVPSVSPAGHVSMLAGSAATTLHPRLLGWIAGHEAPRALAV